MTASTEKPVTKNSSRRALLAGALGGIGAVAAGAVGRVRPVRAEGENIVIGGEYLTALSRTRLVNQSNDEDVFVASSSFDGIGVLGTSYGSFGVEGSSTNWTGVYGTSGSHFGVSGNSASSIGVYGQTNASGQPAVRGRSYNSNTGVHGYSSAGATAIPPAKHKTGVYGEANQDASSKGVWGFSGKGVGLYGQANRAGYALRSRGRVRFDKVSGVKTIPAGSTTATVSPGVNVSSASFVLLTPKTNIGSRGLWFTTQPSADTFKIRMSSTRSSNTRVAWLLLR